GQMLGALSVARSPPSLVPAAYLELRRRRSFDQGRDRPSRPHDRVLQIGPRAARAGRSKMRRLEAEARGKRRPARSARNVGRCRASSGPPRIVTNAKQRGRRGIAWAGANVVATGTGGPTRNSPPASGRSARARPESRSSLRAVLPTSRLHL